jgi:CDP-diacylglycerol--glycerol-3-phosphate 3-phosphatidyltransferase
VRSNAANLITICRIGLAPVLLVLAWHGEEHAFLACLILSLLSDIIDGQIARRFHLTSELGTRLDSWADFLTYASVPFATYWMRPDLVSSEKIAFIATIASYALPVAVGIAKFRCLTSYHTLMARISAYLLGASVVVLFAHGPRLPFRIAVCVLVCAEIEEICITLILPKPKSNVRSYKRAMEIRHSIAGRV